MSSPLKCLVTGASGYIGGRLVPELLGAGYSVRCMARDPGKLADRPWSDDVKIAQARRHRPGGGAAGAARTSTSPTTSSTRSGSEARSSSVTGTRPGSSPSRGRAPGCAGSSTWAASSPAGPSDLSPHLRSRAEVGDILLASGVPTAVLQAAVIIGSGSASFEMLRYLTERLPVMVTPTWVHTRIQPIAVRDVLRYLVGCASLPPGVSRRFDIGGPDILTYAEMMRRYAQVAGLRPRVILPVPVLTPAAVLAVGRLGDPGPCGPGPAARRVAQERGGLLGARHRRLRARPARRPDPAG